MSKAGESFDEVWEKLKAEDKTGTFEKAEVLSFISCEALEYAYNSGYATAKAEFERPQGEWIKETNATFRCSACNHRIPFEYDEINEHMVKIIKPRFCENCGADMRGISHE